MDNLLRFVKNQKYLVFDTETEGLNLVKHQPYQISWILYEGDREISRHNKFIKGCVITKGAAKVTKIDVDYYKDNAEDPLVVYNDFAKYLFDTSIIPVAHNLLAFDVYMIRNLQKKCKMPVDFSYLQRSIDTKALATALFKGVDFNPHDPNNFLEWQYKMADLVEKGLKTNLELMLKHYDIPYDKERLHEALYDVEMLNLIFQKIIWNIEVPNLLSSVNYAHL